MAAACRSSASCWNMRRAFAARGWICSGRSPHPSNGQGDDLYKSSMDRCAAATDPSRSELNLLRQSEEESAPSAELWRAHAHAAAVADLIDFVEDVEEIDARRQARPAHQREILTEAQIDRNVLRDMVAIGCRAITPQTGAVEQIAAYPRTCAEIIGRTR